MALDEAENVPRQRCQTDHVMLHVLPAAAKTLGVIGFKAYTTGRNGGAVPRHPLRRQDRRADRDPPGRLPRPGADRGGQRRGDEEPGPAGRQRRSACSAPASRPARSSRRSARCARSRGRSSTAATRSGGRRSPREMAEECGVEVVPVGDARGGGAGTGHRHHRDDAAASRCCTGRGSPTGRT